MKDILYECLTRVAGGSDGILDAESKKINIDDAVKVTGLMATDHMPAQPIGFIH